ncbi:ATP-dependent DNA helicase PIF1-like [Neltuma alba]|uniref:ATP-dependent DNA helicase PIF1-like n=1 Tax=Neltuma alba TaxID=207710 RepID=UPI0010A540F2|nr:ATP-dependent DNA helicase PIF1-like [Prosopis alba]
MTRTLIIEGTDIFPAHCVSFMRIFDVLWGIPADWGLIDVYGIFKFISETELSKWEGLNSKAAILVLRDSHCNAISFISLCSNNEVTMMLHGGLVETALAKFEGHMDDENLFVVVQYVVAMGHGSQGHHIPLLDKQHTALNEIDKLLKANGMSLNDFPSLPLPVDVPTIDVSNQFILQELNYDRESLHLEAEELIRSLNSEQKEIFDRVMSSLIVNNCKGRFFFVYGYGGTGKTFLWNALTYALHAKGNIVLTVASSGIAATLIPSGRTAHSRFAIPIQINDSSVCSIKQNSPLGHLIKCTKLIIWDEVPMVQRYCVEAVDRTFKDIMHCQEPFCGKCIVMGGDFRQILPVIPKGSRATIVDACITSSLLWNHCTVFRSTRNMRLNSSSINQGMYSLEKFSKWLLDVGDGNLGLPHDGVVEIEIPHEFLLTNYTNPFKQIVSSTYSDLRNNFSRNDYFTDRAILAATIEYVNEINEYMCSLLPGKSVGYLSCDTVCRSSEDSDFFDNLYTTEFLNSINCSGLPPHKLSLKVGAPIMLLRNINQASRPCNSTRLRISQLGKTVIEAITLNGSRPNEKVLLHRMDMNPSESRWPFRMQRRQFPITLSFAMTINKSQGQSLNYVVLFLTKPVFTHGQLYVALSRIRSIKGLKIVINESGSCTNTKTRNVYREIFRNVSQV